MAVSGNEQLNVQELPKGLSNVLALRAPLKIHFPKGLT